MSTLMLFVENLWWMLTESAPWLLLGFTIAGVINVLVPSKWIHRSLGKKGLSNIARAAVIGAPLPLCSCGVIPTAMGIRRAGASRGGTAAFLVATPETGVDSVSITYALMGPIMAIARPISAITSAIAAGTLVESMTRQLPEPAKEEPAKPSCCSTRSSSNQAPAKPPAPWQQGMEKVSKLYRFAFGKLLKDITLWLSIGLVGAALIRTFVPVSFFTEWGSGIWAMLAMVLVGLPMYICATASTPLAASLMLAGISPGAALVFMLTGPATNIATLGVIRNELGGRALIGYLSGVIGTAILLGLGLDALLNTSGWSIPLAAGHTHEHTSLFSVFCAVGLLGLIVKNYLPRLAAG